GSDQFDEKDKKGKAQRAYFNRFCNNTGFTKLQKMAIGLVLATIGMGAAALCERQKLAVAKANGGLSPSPIRVFLLPQFLLVDSGNAFTYTGQLDFLVSSLARGSSLAPYPLVSSSAVSWFGLLIRWFKPRKLTPPPDSAASDGSPAEEDKC
ncbi:hypothetical protein C1H46_017263, partial [Malus baccata]